MSAFGFSSAADALAFASQAGANVKFVFGGGDFVYIENTLLADLNAEDIVI